MPQDAFTLRFLTSELSDALVGGKVNKIIQPDNDNVVFTIYNKNKIQKLLACVNPSSPRVSICDEDFLTPLTAPNFCMLLRKHLLGATISKISLIGFDRIIKIDFTPSSEYFDENPKTIYLELMGRYSNIILTMNDKILGGNRGINVFDNGVRPLIVGKTYTFPPVGEKKLPNDKSLIEYFEYCTENLAEHICKGVQGIALSTAQEIVFRFKQENPNAEFSAEAFFEYFNNFLFDTKLKPCVYFSGDDVLDVCALPYETFNNNFIPFEHLYEAENYYYKATQTSKIFNQFKNRLNSIVSAQIKKQKKKLQTIKARELDASSLEENRIKGELILANIYQIKNGQPSVTLLNYYDGLECNIELDTALSPAQNAEKYYKKYNKQKRTLTALKPQIQALESEVDYLDSVLFEIEFCDNILDLQKVSDELVESGLIKDNSQKKKSMKKEELSCREYLFEDYIIKVGRNNVENDKLTFSAKPSDVWLHVKDFHSSHVIISCPDGKLPPQKVLTFAGEVCAYYSNARLNGKTEIVYTFKKFVKKPPKSKMGFCVYENYKSFNVVPNKRAEFLKTH